MWGYRVAAILALHRVTHARIAHSIALIELVLRAASSPKVSAFL